MKKFFAFILSIFVWAGCLTIGTELSHRRPLWNDELYTQVNTLAQGTYSDILSGRILEGNNSPLFYLIQKGACDLLGYKFQGTWNGEWFVYDDRSQVVLRIVSNIFMSTAIAGVFFMFANFYSTGLAVVALAAMLAVPATWLYWVEARPYSLWILLTVIQSVFLIRSVSEDKNNGRAWKGLALSHVLLSLTIAFGVVQALAASIVLWAFNERRWSRYIGLAAVPTAIGIFYYEHSPKFKYWFHDGPVRLILDNVPLEYWVLFLVYVGAVVFFDRFQKTADRSLWVDRYIPFAVLMAAEAFGILGLLKWKAHPGMEGFAISSRYFLFLVPIFVIALTLAVRGLWQRFHGDRWLRVNLWIIVGGFLLLRAFKTYIMILSSGTFLHLIR